MPGQIGKIRRQTGGTGPHGAKGHLQGDEIPCLLPISFQIAGPGFFHRAVSHGGEQLIPMQEVLWQQHGPPFFIQNFYMDAPLGRINFPGGNLPGHGQDQFGNIGSKVRDFDMLIINACHGFSSSARFQRLSFPAGTPNGNGYLSAAIDYKKKNHGCKENSA